MSEWWEKFGPAVVKHRRKCYLLRHETNEYRSRSLVGSGGGAEMMRSVWDMVSWRGYWDIPVKISSRSSA